MFLFRFQLHPFRIFPFSLSTLLLLSLAKTKLNHYFTFFSCPFVSLFECANSSVTSMIGHIQACHHLLDKKRLNVVSGAFFCLLISFVSHKQFPCYQCLSVTGDVSTPQGMCQHHRGCVNTPIARSKTCTLHAFKISNAFK